ncbi:hemerythrin domain-containing protein [Sphingoaurantiacus capsulatus]|uniref:Hemerythrin domain-containing protein n=1 Tax=Sphingoaurantiacus capsulatus TaxID=1771310 RepID=A0ABV7XFX0_9SPHN
MASQPVAESVADILELMREDHGRFEKLFSAYAEADDAEAKRVAVCRIHCALAAHTQAAEELLFDAIVDAGADDAAVEEARAEHEGMRKTLQSILAVKADDPTYDMKVRMLQKEIMHHAREEEGELFAQAREASLDLAGLGERYTRRRDELTPQFERETGLA